jgi:hypothetical protein
MWPYIHNHHNWLADLSWTLKFSQCSHLPLHLSKLKVCGCVTSPNNSSLLASRLSKYLASQNTFQELLRTLIGKLLCEIFLHAWLYLYHNWIFCGNYTITITLSQCSRNVNMILNLLINTSRTFFWLRFFLFNLHPSGILMPWRQICVFTFHP